MSQLLGGFVASENLLLEDLWKIKKKSVIGKTKMILYKQLVISQSQSTLQWKA